MSALGAKTTGLESIQHKYAANLNYAFAPDTMKLGVQDTTAVDPNQAKGLQNDPGAKGTGGAVDFADTAAAWTLSSGIDYGWGSGHPANGADPHPSKLDCSGLVNWALARIGQPQIGTSATQAGKVTPISLEEARKTKGALVFLSRNGEASGVHHVGISMGDGTTAEARDTGGQVGVYAWSSGNNWNLAGRIPGLSYTGAAGTGTGGKPGKANTGAVGGNVDSSGTSSLDGNIGSSLLNVWQWLGNSDYLGGSLLSGARALMNDVPVMNTVNELMTAGLRQYCSAPNGDFIGWFPDYFGWWGTCGKMIIQPIEILDNFAIAKSDANLKTHWFVTGATTGVEGYGDASSITQMLDTAGIASVEMPDLMKSLFRVGNEFDDRGREFLARFGARPEFEAIDTITGHRQEFFFSVFRFMLNWASQWTARINLTFMPELWPGMLVCFPAYGVQAYVQEVSHEINMQNNAGFTTSINCIGWSSIGQNSAVKGLPVGAPI
jgi:cell wall-associated NlpC family hydrolase